MSTFAEPRANAVRLPFRLSAWISCSALILLAMVRDAHATPALRVPTAFYYGTHVPSELLTHFDRLVVEPDNVRTVPSGGRAEVFAYVSVGEVHPSRPWRKELPASLVLRQGAAGAADIVDTRSEVWRTFVLDRIVEPLYARGFRGLFLDTLDSYERIVLDQAERKLHAEGIATLVTAIRGRHPDVKILVNRGFAVLPLLPAPPDGLVAESLFRSADLAGRAYREVSPADTANLLRALAEVRSRWSIPITIIDYTPPSDRALRRETALRIWKAGFDPYVTTPTLDGIGVGRSEVVPRRVLLLYRHHPDEGYLGQQDACVLVAPILESMGYAVDYVDVREPLSEPSAGRYAGIVTLVPEHVENVDPYRRWLLRQMDQGVRVAFVDGFGFDADAAFLSRLGLAAASATVKAPISMTAVRPWLGFEAPVRPLAHGLPPVRRRSESIRSLLRLTDAAGATWDAGVLGPWGGAIFAPYVLTEDLEQDRRWIIDPFQFLKEALALEPIPAPDVTTESGRRIMTIHVDGDAFMSRAERAGHPFAARVILDEILRRYPVPHTVSIVEGEVGPTGLYPADSPKLEAIAREIFRLPYVELGTHTFSHPFDWAAAEAGRVTSPSSTLPIPNYRFDADREIGGSIAYINSRLAPPGKSVKVVQWSGDCSPSRDLIARAQRLGVENVNGGGATRTTAFPSLTRASALGIPMGDGVYQVFAPVENENVYTNDWQGPYYGYERVIETFDLNDWPRRISPISIYYHFYSGVKTASLTALRRVYEWALAQETTRLYLSQYAARVRAFQEVTLARHIDDGAWEIGNLGELRTVRFDPGLGWPDVARSTGVAGVRDTSTGRYVHLARDSAPVVFTNRNAPEGPYLRDANASILAWRAGKGGATFRLSGNEPLVFTIGAAEACSLRTASGTVLGVAKEGHVRFALPMRDTEEAHLACR